MSAAPKLGGFVVLLAAVFGGALAVGAASGPFDTGGGVDHTMSAQHAVTDISSSGDPTDGATHEPSATIVDGFEVALDGDPAIGVVELSFTVRRDGSVLHPVRDLEGSGRLVVLRSADLVALPVTPRSTNTSAASFDVEFASGGEYRLLFDFVAAERRHTAALTLAIPAPTATTYPATSHPEGH